MGILVTSGTGEPTRYAPGDRGGDRFGDKRREELRLGAIRRLIQADDYYVPAALIAEQIITAAFQDRLCRQD